MTDNADYLVKFGPLADEANRTLLCFLWVASSVCTRRTGGGERAVVCSARKTPLVSPVMAVQNGGS